MTSPDVLVVGGGPAGAATAAWAARAGLSVLLVDRARFPRHKACAEYLSPEAGRDLEALGVLADVERATPERLFGFRLVADDGSAVTGRFAGATNHPPFRPYGLALPRAVLDGLVLEAARRAGAVVMEGVTFEHLRFDGGRVRGAVLRRGGERHTVDAGLVVGADGLNSRVAHQLGVARAGAPRRLALVAHLAGVEDVSDVGEMFAQRGWYLGLAAIGGGLTNIAMVVPQADVRAAVRDPAAFFRARLARIPELARRCRNATIVRNVLLAGPFARRARRVTHDGALLVGDAADFFDPFTGEGIFAALRGGRLAADAAVAALARGAASRAALRPYDAARRRAFAGKRLLERLVGLAAVRPALMRRFTHRLAAQPRIADLWVGAAGDTVPVRTLFAPRHLAPFLF
jgi:menaquinone-9 beta-reductase